MKTLELDEIEIMLLLGAMRKQRRHSRLYVNGFGNDRENVIYEKLKALQDN